MFSAERPVSKPFSTDRSHRSFLLNGSHIISEVGAARAPATSWEVREDGQPSSCGLLELGCCYFPRRLTQLHIIYFEEEAFIHPKHWSLQTSSRQLASASGINKHKPTCLFKRQFLLSMFLNSLAGFGHEGKCEPIYSCGW